MPTLQQGAPRPAVHPWLDGLAARCAGPGGHYNMGNALGLASGMAFAVAGAEAGGGASAVLAHLAGSPGALALSAAMVVFFVAGEIYHRAYRGPDGVDADLVRRADFLSGVGALVLSVALALFGSLWLALVSTVLLAGGKFGNALVPGGWPVLWGDDGRGASRRTDLFRIAPLVSRAPAMLALVVQVAGGGAVLEPAVLLVCYLLWCRADVLLLRA